MTNQSYILSDEFVVLVYDAPRSNADCDNVVSCLNDGVTQRIADMLHNAYIITQYLITRRGFCFQTFSTKEPIPAADKKLFCQTTSNKHCLHSLLPKTYQSTKFAQKSRATTSCPATN